MASKKHPIVVDGATLLISSPDKIVFPDLGITKLELIEFYIAVAEGALRHCGNRPMVLKRYPKGIADKEIFQKRAPKGRPDCVTTATLHYKSGWSASEAVLHDVEGLVWLINTGCVDINPHPLRADDMEHPDELRIDLDPIPGVPWEQVRQVALCVRDVLDEHGLVGWPKTSGGRGIHINVRIRREWTQPEARKAALAIAREVERRMPGDATSAWKKEDREGVFVDYNQNAKDRTVASAYSVRPNPQAKVSAPLSWDEVGGCRSEDFTLRSFLERYRSLGDLHEDIDGAVGELSGLLELHDHQAATPKEKRAPMPLLVISKHTDEDLALAGLERWKARNPEAATHLQPADVLHDKMRGRYSTWTRIRVNLRHVPEALRPPQEEPDPNVDPTADVNRWRESRMRKLEES